MSKRYLGGGVSFEQKDVHQEFSEDGGGGGSSTLSGLTDVDISSPSDGQTLVFNSTSGKWENGAGGVLVLHEIPVESNRNTRAQPAPMVRLDKTWQEIYDAGVCFVEIIMSKGDETSKLLLTVCNIMTPIQEIGVTAYTVEAFEASNTTRYTYEVKEGGANGYPERTADD